MKNTFLVSLWDIEKQEVTIILPDKKESVSYENEELFKRLHEEWEDERKPLCIFIEWEEEFQIPEEVIEAFLKDFSLRTTGEQPSWTVRFSRGPIAEYSLRVSKGPEAITVADEELRERIKRGREEILSKFKNELQDLKNLKPYIEKKLLKEASSKLLYALGEAREFGIITTSEYNGFRGRIENCQEGENVKRLVPKRDKSIFKKEKAI